MKNRELTGKIFDIKRFSLHDGPGVRTTIFLKGCDLNCLWCQNPEGISFETNLLYFKKKCIGCGSCLDTCPCKALSFHEKQGITVDEKTCLDTLTKGACWKNETLKKPLCVEACPSLALALDCQELSVEQAVKEALKDREFFRENGGVTISGGEPFFQFEFTVDILKALRKAGVSTAVETSLYVKPTLLEGAMEYIDTLIGDFKIFDDDQHRKYIGASNALIKENLEWLLKNKDLRDKIIIRTPLIPEYTATKENIENISKYISSLYPSVHYELLNYNPLAKAKYELVKKQFCFGQNPRMFTKDEMSYYQEVAKESGITNLVY